MEWKDSNGEVAKANAPDTIVGSSACGQHFDDGNPNEEAATHSHQLLMLIGALRPFFVDLGHTSMPAASAVRREPADKVRLVDRGSADRQGKIYPNVHRPQPTRATLADEEMEAYQSVPTMPTTPRKLDPFVVPISITDGCGGLKGTDE